MRLVEMKHNLAIETAKLIFRSGLDVVFIGGTALNSVYLNYRFSEDLDFGYTEKNKKADIEKVLRKSGYVVEPMAFKFRDLITFEGISIKMDVILYELKYGRFVERMLGEVRIKTLDIPEFIVEKTISFLTREEMAGIARDAYDLFAIHKEYHNVFHVVRKAAAVIKRKADVMDHNIYFFLGRKKEVISALRPYLKKEVQYDDVADFVKRLKVVLHD
ncbi:MAG: nucleotidyl transferase AbiEii/AbiGii toxin family protein [Candidatus Anstonellales archaeon]